MRVIHIFTEELSIKNVLEVILPKILPIDVYYRIYPHQGKEDLEKALSSTLPSISKIPGSKILVTRDQDNNDCIELKQHLDEIISNNCACEYSIRIVCKELESWFLGDMEAIEQAYPRFKAEQHVNKAEFRNVDKIAYANRQLLKHIPEYIDRQTLPKLEVSENISQFMDFSKNKSDSFNHTIKAILKLAT